jgi:signal peptidase II
MQTPRREGSAVTDRASHKRLWLTVGLGFALDVASKYLAWSFLEGPYQDGGRQVWLIQDFLCLIASKNPGIVFGFNFSDGFGIGVSAGRAITILMTLATSALIFYVFAMARARQKWMHLWCGLVLAGAFGNLYDRLLFGYVRDLIQMTAHMQFSRWTLNWPYIFNLADVYLVVGVVAVALEYIFGPKMDAEAESEPSPEED